MTRVCELRKPARDDAMLQQHAMTYFCFPSSSPGFVLGVHSSHVMLQQHAATLESALARRESAMAEVEAKARSVVEKAEEEKRKWRAKDETLREERKSFREEIRTVRYYLKWQLSVCTSVRLSVHPSVCLSLKLLLGGLVCELVSF